jgi:antitoxin component of MazEF toxin-antitoxin module
MPSVTVGKWGKNLAIRVPLEIARAIGLRDGELVEVSAREGDIVIRRPAEHGRADAEAAAEEIIAESRSHPLSRTDIRQLIEEGRRG